MCTVRAVNALNGESLVFELSSAATVFDLKRQMRVEHRLRKSMVTVFFGSTLLGNGFKLYDACDVPPWCYIADVMGAETPREVTVSFVVGKPACEACGREAPHFCQTCRAPYCSRACQLRDWPSHRRNPIHLGAGSI